MKITRRQLKQIIQEASFSRESARDIDDAFYDLRGRLRDHDDSDAALREYIKRKLDELIRDLGF